jgi:two-component system, LytTR family, sensor kinase
MLLQPLVENAIRHGVAPLIEGGTIAIESKIHDNRLLMTIRNSGPRTSKAVPQNGESSKGIGLANTATRLKTLYGDNQRFSLCSQDTGGCEVTVELPFRTAALGVEGVVCGL